MALIICPECNNSMSDTASACPHCGYSMDKDLIEMAKNPTSFWLKTITDLYICGMFVALNFNLVGVEHFFFQFSVTIGEYTFYPWAIVPAMIASLVRNWLVGTVMVYSFAECLVSLRDWTTYSCCHDDHVKCLSLDVAA